VPRQLPPDVTNFTGRHTDLARLDDLLGRATTGHPQSVVISAVAGPAGGGKTALAVHWAHRARGRFPDGDLYVNLRGYAPGPSLTPLQVLEGFLRALDVPPRRIPPELEARTGLFRTLLDGRRLLVVLDNANSADQVRPLLPGSPGCLVVITSRSQLSGLVARDGARRMTLDMLPPHEAITLLRLVIGADRVGAEPEAAAELARRCVYLPLALRIAAEHAAARPQARLADLGAGHDRLDELATPDDDETTAVREVFSWSYRALTPQVARAFRLLGLHTGPGISIPAAAALTGTATTQARRLLNMLTGVHLLEQVPPDHYRFHDLLRDYAAERAHADEPEDGRTHAINRVLTWYLRVAEATSHWLYANHAHEGDGEGQPWLPVPYADRAQALEWYEMELANLVAATRLAAVTGEDEIAWRLPVALRNFFQLRMPFADWITTYEIALAAAQRLKDGSGKAAVLGGLGGAYHYLGRREEAIDHHRQALAIHREIGSQEGQAKDLVNLGGTHADLEQFDEATDCLQRALTISRATLGRNCEGHALESLGAIFQSLGRYEEAVDYLQQAVGIFRETGRFYGEGVALTHLAETYLALQRFDETIDYCQQSMVVQRKLGDRHGESETLRIYAAVSVATGHLAEAHQSWRRALAILEDLNHPDASKVRARLAAADIDNSGQSGIPSATIGKPS